ncbi:MAG: two-component system sensor histidine kinase BaeS [Cellvibrionaceae bacterium]|jgi:two-component system sensor histidine kinase BaeS
MLSLRTRLIAVYVGLIVLGFGGLTAWSSLQITNTTLSDYGNTLHTQAVFLASRLSETLEYNPQSAPTTLNESAKELNADITLYARSKNISHATAKIPSQLIETKTYIIEPDQLGVLQIVTSAPILHDSRIEGYIQINVPQSVPLETVRQRQATLWGVFAAFTLLGISVSLWLVTSLTKPLDDLQRTALNMADGDLTQRVENPSRDEIGAVGRAFNTMAEQVESIVAEQRAFASNASHELRTPLTTIRLRTEMMVNDDLDEETKKLFIAEIDGEVMRMSGLVSDLLLLSRFDAKRLSAGEEQIDAVRLMKKVIADFQAKAAEKQIRLDSDLPTHSIPITANINHLETIFRNLIDNGLKYTPENGLVKVNLSLKEDVMLLMVEDNGEGIPAEDLPKIGKRFFRVDRARSRNIQGTGLGLALISSILELYNGSLNIHSEGIGKGTAVVVTWPI